MNAPAPTSYVPPLRFAIRWCVDVAHGAAVLPETVATIAQVAPDRAAAYCSILVAGKALQPAHDGPGFVTGPNWSTWLQSRCKTRPKTTGTAGDEMNSLRRVVCCNLRDLRVRMGWTPTELARRAGVYQVYVFRAERFCEPPPAIALLLLARTLGTTIEQLGILTASLETHRV